MMLLLKRPEIARKAEKIQDNRLEDVAKEMEKEKVERNMLENIDLTEREKEIVKLVLAGLSNREIGEQLYIAESTVKKHMSHIFEKLEVKNREQLKQKFR